MSKNRKVGKVEALAYALTYVGNPCDALADKVDALIDPLTHLKLGLRSVKGACDALALELLKVAKFLGEDQPDAQAGEAAAEVSDER